MTEEQLRSIFDSAGKERGRIAGIPADLWWSSFLAFVWTTSERKSAALAATVAGLNLQTGVCTIPPDVRKGRKKWGVYHLWPETIPLIARAVAIHPQRTLVWPWEKCDGTYYTTYNRILRGAGIEPSRRVKTQGLRVSHATWLKVAGGDPTRQLMHDSAETTNKHYIDPRMLPSDQPKLFIPWG